MNSFWVYPLFIFFGSVSADWELVIDKEGIQVFVRDTGLAMKDSKAVTVIHNIRLEEIEREFLRVENHRNWIHTVYESKTIGSNDLGPVIYYKADAPWPVSDRDIITQVRIRKEKNTLFFNNYALPEYLPEEEDYVRVLVSTNDWTFVDLGDGTIETTFISRTDPGGSVPHWLIKLSASDSPYRTLRNFRDYLENKQ